MYAARRFRMVSRMPPISPAAISSTNSVSKTFGWSLSESARVEPDSTFTFTLVSTSRKARLSSWLARMSRHCTSGRPASIIVANWRVKMMMSFWEIPPMPGSLKVSCDFLRILTFCSAIARKRCWTEASSAASIWPFFTSPVLVFPSHVQMGIFRCAGCALAAAAGAAIQVSLRALRLHRAVHARAGSGGEDVAQLVRIGAAGHRLLEGNETLLHQRRQRLVEGLHAELRLADLHRGVDLVDLVLADQVPDGGVGDHDLDRQHAARSARLGDEVLRHHAFQHERELRPELRLLVGREHVEDAVDGLHAG